MAKTPKQKAAEAEAKAAKEAEAKAKAAADTQATADPAPEAVKDEAPAPAGAMTKAAFQKIIDAYKLSNPVKYEMKKDELARKLALLK